MTGNHMTGNHMKNLISPAPWPGAHSNPAFWLATWGGSGMLARAPGTWGSLAALPCAWVILQCPTPWALPVAAVAVLAAGLWASGVYMVNSHIHDPGQIVVDEVVGLWVTLLPLGHNFRPLEWLLAFGLFRLFDIWKPWPISVADARIGGAWGVMLDDILAGLLAAGLLWALGMMGYIHVFR
jgi:phosphatidylglycerophosphatase A